MITVVTKSFEGFGRQLKTGDVIDTTGTQHEAKLIAQRYIRPATETEIKAFTDRVGDPTPLRGREPKQDAGAQDEPQDSAATDSGDAGDDETDGQDDAASADREPAKPGKKKSGGKKKK
jgi:hypothetical protein